jgi:hypothetical protein
MRMASFTIQWPFKAGETGVGAMVMWTLNFRQNRLSAADRARMMNSAAPLPPELGDVGGDDFPEYTRILGVD